MATTIHPSRASAVFATLVFAIASCSAQPPEPLEQTGAAPLAEPSRDVSVALQIGNDVAPATRERITTLLGQVPTLAVTLSAPDADPRRTGKRIVIGIGDTAATRLLIRQAQVRALGSEGFVIAADDADGTRYLAGWGNARSGQAGPNLGNGFAAYALLERLGFRFLHPLDPETPRELVDTGAFTATETPQLATRGIHLHTMHPIELTHVLNGWGPDGPQDDAGFRQLTDEWALYLEWLLANRQNTVEWVLLEADAWRGFSRSDERLTRLASLNAMADAHGVTTVASAALRLRQQHAFRLIPSGGDVEAQYAELRATVDWLARAGFDAISTEAGTSEFTHEAAELMLGTMNELTRYANDVHGLPVSIKVHASTGQNVPGYVDPVTGGDLNINFLPYYADARLTVMPHTVQHYCLDDPAPTYGNTDFSGIFRFAERASAQREVIWYPETAYWVSFDIDVPLFLPIYAERRVHDLRLMNASGVDLDGQMIFSSGWEWGYWLNDVVAARAAWNAHHEALSDADAFARILGDIFPGDDRPLTDALVGIAQHQHELLILGRHGIAAPESVVRRNGQAYLQGFEAFDDVADLADDSGIASRLRTQPDKLGLVEMQNPFHAAPRVDEIDDLLRAMERTFARDAADLEDIAATRPYAAELARAMRMTALRAEQVHSLYAFADGRGDVHLANARRVLDEALAMAGAYVYRADPERIASWGMNPTAYRFGYLWTARSLYYWFRDEAKADVRPLSPCYLNILDFLEIGFGEGLTGAGAEVVHALSAMPVVGSLAECLVDPRSAPALGGWR